MNAVPFDARRGARAAIIGGLIGFAGYFALCVVTSRLPAVTDVSLSLACRPWWRWSNWISSLVVGAAAAIVFGLLAAFRPRRKRAKN